MYTVEAIILGGTFWNEDTNSVKPRFFPGHENVYIWAEVSLK